MSDLLPCSPPSRGGGAISRLLVRPRVPALALALLTLPPGLGAQTPGAETQFLQAFLFGDVLFRETENDVTDGFSLGQIVGHANASLAERLIFFGEVSVTARTTGYVLAMERAILRYDFSDPLKVSVGRYHTPVSYWNTEFHHGLWLQGSISRPEAIRFGSRYIPVHFVGLMVEGNLTDVPLYYSAGVGNGRTESLVGAGDAGDVNAANAFVVSASMRPRSLFGFRFGAAAYFDRLAQGGGDVANERILSAHVVWDRTDVEAVVEFIHVAHEDLVSSGSTGSPSWYAHVGYRLPTAVRLTPYLRWEDMSIDAQDPVFDAVLADYEAAIAGVRYDFESFAALKAEYRGEKRGGGSRVSSWLAQASFAIPLTGR